MVSTSQDPTFQNTGGLVVNFKDLTAATYRDPKTNQWYGWRLTPNTPTYGPPDQPPPQWTLGKQYQTFPGYAFSFGSIVNDRAASLKLAVYVPDVTTQQVMSGKQYIFTVDMGSETIRLYWIISGIAGGSTLLPGFGLYNLKDRPNAWTYVTPPAFTGQWAIPLLNPGFSEVLTLRVAWVPVRYTQPWGNVARLTFTFDGGVTPPDPGQAEEFFHGGRGEESWELLPGGDPYELTPA